MDQQTQAGAKQRRKPAANRVQRGSGPVENKNLTLSEEALERLCVAALKYKCSESALVDWLICTSDHTRRYVIQDRGKGAIEEPGLQVDAANAEVETLPAGKTDPPPAPAPAGGAEEGGKPRERFGKRKAG